MLSHSVMSNPLWPHGLLPARFLHPWNFPGKNTSESYSHSVVSDYLQPHELYSPWNFQARILEWVAIPFSKGFSNPGIKPRSPTLQADSLSAESQGKPKNTGVGSLSFLQQIFPTQELNRVSCIAGRFFTN